MSRITRTGSRHSRSPDRTGNDTRERRTGPSDNTSGRSSSAAAQHGVLRVFTRRSRRADSPQVVSDSAGAEAPQGHRAVSEPNSPPRTATSRLQGLSQPNHGGDESMTEAEPAQSAARNQPTGTLNSSAAGQMTTSRLVIESRARDIIEQLLNAGANLVGVHRTLAENTARNARRLLNGRSLDVLEHHLPDLLTSSHRADDPLFVELRSRLDRFIREHAAVESDMVAYTQDPAPIQLLPGMPIPEGMVLQRPEHLRRPVGNLAAANSRLVMPERREAETDLRYAWRISYHNFGQSYDDIAVAASRPGGSPERLRDMLMTRIGAPDPREEDEMRREAARAQGAPANHELTLRRIGGETNLQYTRRVYSEHPGAPLEELAHLADRIAGVGNFLDIVERGFVEQLPAQARRTAQAEINSSIVLPERGARETNVQYVWRVYNENPGASIDDIVQAASRRSGTPDAMRSALIRRIAAPAKYNEAFSQLRTISRADAEAMGFKDAAIYNQESDGPFSKDQATTCLFGEDLSLSNPNQQVIGLAPVASDSARGYDKSENKEVVFMDMKALAQYLLTKPLHPMNNKPLNEDNIVEFAFRIT